MQMPINARANTNVSVLPPGDERLPLFARLRDVIASRIAALEWSAGQAIPSEQELARTYGVSVHTLRRAVDQLVREGLLERKQGSGTYVRRPSFDASLFRWFNFGDKSSDGGRTVPESRILERKVIAAPDDIAAKLKLKKPSKLVQILRLRLWGGMPVVTESVCLSYGRYKSLIAMDEHEVGPLMYPLYEHRFGQIVTSVEDELSLGQADARHAPLLGVRIGDPVVIVERLSLGVDGTPIDWRRAYGRGDRFRYRVRLT